jgi:hypothetical protein
MACGHAERNLALLRRPGAETRQLLESLDQPDPERSAWPQETTSQAPRPAHRCHEQLLTNLAADTRRE